MKTQLTILILHFLGNWRNSILMLELYTTSLEKMDYSPPLGDLHKDFRNRDGLWEWKFLQTEVIWSDHTLWDIKQLTWLD